MPCVRAKPPEERNTADVSLDFEGVWPRAGLMAGGAWVNPR